MSGIIGDIATITPQFPSLTGGTSIAPTQNADPNSWVPPNFTLAPNGLEATANPGTDTGLGSSLANAVKPVGDFFKSIQDFLSQKASSYLERGGIELIGVIFLIIGLIMLINRSSAESAAQSLGEAISFKK